MRARTSVTRLRDRTGSERSGFGNTVSMRPPVHKTHLRSPIHSLRLATYIRLKKQKKPLIARYRRPRCVRLL